MRPMMVRCGRFSLLVSLLALAVLGSTAMVSAAGAALLWYNGDVVLGGDSYTNRYMGSGLTGLVYDDFMVTSPGWTLTSLWSNNQTRFAGVDQAYWEIRSGVSSHNGGTLLCSGLSAASQAATGRGPLAEGPEYRIEVSGLSLSLDPGRYWRALAPDVSAAPPADRFSYVSETDGLNAVGEPIGNNGRSFYTGSGGYDFENLTVLLGNVHKRDYSMGVAGSVPEPGALALLGLALAGAGGARLIRRRRGR